MLNTCQRVALIERMNSNTRGSADLSPRVVFVTIGKKVMMDAIMIFGEIPNPNQIVSSGMMAMIGTELETMMYGKTPRSKKREWTMPAESKIPMMADRLKPASASSNVSPV